MNTVLLNSLVLTAVALILLVMSVSWRYNTHDVQATREVIAMKNMIQHELKELETFLLDFRLDRLSSQASQNLWIRCLEWSRC